jgi:hypothetical protein
MSTQTPEQPPQKSCFERVFIFLIRLIFAFVVGIAIGVGIYFGVRLLYGEYQSITQDYDARLSALENSLSQSDQLVADRMTGLQTRLENLEIQGDTYKNIIADLENRLESHDEFRSYQATAVTGQQETISSMQEVILELQTEVGTVQSDLEMLENSLSGVQDDISALETNAKVITDAVEESQDVTDITNSKVQDVEARMTILEQEMTFLVAMELLTRARLNLVQGNYTLAQSDIGTAINLLVTLQEELPPLQASYVGEIIEAANDTLTFLPGAPLTAGDKLEGVWQMLASGLPSEEDSTIEAEESIPDSTPTVTPTLNP